VCCVQQSSIFIRVSIARLINERRRRDCSRVRGAGHAARLFGCRPLLRLLLPPARRSVSPTTSRASRHAAERGGFPTSAPRKIRRFGLCAGARGIPDGLTMPMARRWWTCRRRQPHDSPRTPAGTRRAKRRRRVYCALCAAGPSRTTGPAHAARRNKVSSGPMRPLVYPVLGFLVWPPASASRITRVGSRLGRDASRTISLRSRVSAPSPTQDLIESLTPPLPRR